MERAPQNPESPAESGESYSELIRDPEKARELIEGSYLRSTQPVEKWEQGRRFIAEEINRDGSILDIGCANGFLLKSLQEWSGRDLDPYGIDSNPRDVEKARSLFPAKEDHFSASSLKEFLENAPAGFPPEFDFVYWSIWDNYDPSKEEIEGLLGMVKPGGRLILGSYPNDEKQREIDQKKFSTIKDWGYKVDPVENPASRLRQSVAVIEKGG